MFVRPLIFATATLLALSACDSQSQLIVNRANTTVNLPSGMTLTTVITGNTNSTLVSFAAADLPAELAGAPNLKLVLGGRPMPLSRGASGSLQTALPPQSAPPSPDANGVVTLVLQSDTGSRLVTVRYNAPRTLNNTPVATS